MVLSAGPFSREIGARPLVDAFFDTVGCRLEPAGRATRFPAIMADLREGVLPPKYAAEALRELDDIERELRALPASKIMGLTAGVNPDRSAYECLMSPDGHSLLEHFRAAIKESRQSGHVLQVSTARGKRAEVQLSLCIALLGAAWVLIGRKFFGNWILISFSQDPGDHSGLYIWTIGFMLIALGAAHALTAVFPRLRIWFKRRNWATLTLALAFIAVLIFFGMSPR